jgi:hypothetical protein
MTARFARKGAARSRCKRVRIWRGATPYLTKPAPRLRAPIGTWPRAALTGGGCAGFATLGIILVPTLDNDERPGWRKMSRTNGRYLQARRAIESLRALESDRPAVLDFLFNFHCFRSARQSERQARSDSGPILRIQAFVSKCRSLITASPSILGRVENPIAGG